MPESQAVPAVEGQDGGLDGTARRGQAWRAAAARLLRGRPVRWGFVVLTIGLGGYAVAREWTSVRAALASLGAAPVAVALLGVLAALAATMQAWRVLLAGLGSPLPVRAAARIMFIGQLGKYLPGSVWPILAQMELGNAYRVPRHRSASAAVLTMLMSLLTGLLAALVTLPFVAGGTPYRWAFAAAPFLALCLHPRVLNTLLDRLLRLARRPPLEQPLTGRVLVGSLAWSLGAWVCYGAQIWVLAVRLGAPPGQAALLGIGGFAFAWSVGFLVVFAPAGAGIREVLLVALLGPVIGAGSATAVALVSRVLMTAGDLLTAGVATLTSRRPAREDQPAPGPESAAVARKQDPR